MLQVQDLLFSTRCKFKGQLVVLLGCCVLQFKTGWCRRLGFQTDKVYSQIYELVKKKSLILTSCYELLQLHIRYIPQSQRELDGLNMRSITFSVFNVFYLMGYSLLTNGVFSSFIRFSSMQYVFNPLNASVAIIQKLVN